MTIAVLLLFISHYVQDWIFQRGTTARMKLHNALARATHCVWYAFMMTFYIRLIILFTMNGAELDLFVQTALVIYLFVTHFIVDTPDVKKWICRTFRGEIDAPEWYYIKLDEILHAITLVPIVVLFYLVSAAAHQPLPTVTL